MIKELFKKDIYRPIEGVIKADNLSDEAILQEVEEYVVTKEIKEKLEQFFGIYSHTIGQKTEDIGVWISGFFGSGKSHLLKILSYILSSKKVGSKDIGKIFLEKIDDEFLKADIKRAFSIKTDTILFNIDQKADTGAINRKDDAILNVFMKVFNEMRGYYHKQGYIADFEKKLDKNGIYEEFKKRYEFYSGLSWDIGREQFEFEIDSIAKALSDVKNISFESARESIQNLSQNYTLSVEDFVEEVCEYIKKQEPNYRLIFMVDEVGQFIGDNSKLMLNLQTIVESLATKAKGQAWVAVTSQSAVRELIDESKQSKEMDFSKILGRFKVKINLTSQNANEVIKKRLLDKKDEVKPSLKTLYAKHQNSLASIIYFSERGRTYHSYKDSEDFVLTYPFVPYQLELFQSCIIGLSKNNAFQGKHQSIGERSMLDVIQSVAKAIAEKDVGTLASFDYFYDGISEIIVPEFKKLMTTALNNLDEFSLKVLKVLFMVKYVKEFNATLDHITTLLVDNLEVDISELKNRVKKSLNQLVNEFYIQKVGDVYEFLTDIEKDIENEIYAVDIDDRDRYKELSNWIYDNLIGISKFKYENNQFYPFTRKMDDIKVKGKEEELSLNIITPLYDAKSEEFFIHKSLSENDLILVMKNDSEFEKEFELYVKTSKYIPQKRNRNLTSTENQIIIQKQEDNTNRRRDLQNRLKSMLINSNIYFNGKELEIKASEPKTLVENALSKIVPSIFVNIEMLKKEYKEQDIKTILTAKDDLLMGSADGLNEAEEEMLNFIKRETKKYQTVNITKILDTFTSRPYGWYQAAIMSIIAELYRKKFIDMSESGTLLDRNEVYVSLTNNRKFANTIIKPAAKIDERVLKNSKEILVELFPDGKFSSNSPRDIYEEAKSSIEKLLRDLKDYQRVPYHFRKSFDEPVKTISKIDVKFEDFFAKLQELEDELLDMKDDVLDPLLEFMRGSKFEIYKEIDEFVQNNKTNLYHIKNEKKNDLFAILKDEKPFKGRKIVEANNSFKIIKDEVDSLIQETRLKAKEKIENIIKELQNDKNFSKVLEKDRYKIIRPLQNIQNEIENSTNIDFINQLVSDEQLTDLKIEGFDKIEELIPEEKRDKSQDIKKRVSIQELIPKNMQKIESVEDAKRYIEEFENNLLKEINEGKQIII